MVDWVWFRSPCQLDAGHPHVHSVSKFGYISKNSSLQHGSSCSSSSSTGFCTRPHLTAIARRTCLTMGFMLPCWFLHCPPGEFLLALSFAYLQAACDAAPFWTAYSNRNSGLFSNSSRTWRLCQDGYIHGGIMVDLRCPSRQQALHQRIIVGMWASQRIL
jgi:hypothetical protein